METNDSILQKRQKYLYPTKVPYYSEPIHLTKASGSYVWDESGNKYLDVIGGIVSISVGHNHPKIVARAKKMLDEGAIQHTTFLYLSEYMPRLAEKLSNVAPGDLSKCYFTNSGSEANEMAVLTARVATKENMVVALRHGYHGGTSTPLSLCGHSTWKFSSQPQSGVTHAQAPNCYRCPFGQEKDNCSLECAEDVKEVIETTTNGKIAAAIIEPILGVGGFIDAPTDYHKRVYEIVKSFGGLYISDEVQTGVGRTGKNFFAIADSGVVPDLITMAKGLGNGAPIGAVITKSEHAETLRGKLHFNTFGGDPFQAMQAGEVIDIIEEEKLIQNADTMGRYLKEGFIGLMKDYQIIGDVRGRGLLMGMEMVTDRKSKNPASAECAKLMELCKDQNILIGKGGLYGNVVRIAPSLSITKSECDELLTGMAVAFEKLTK
ncbi:MAG: aspartate aminotransferase family protein [Bacteriovoracaceae bacterium]|jgi:4-aminobutyrate aminotransferase-like enzyme|nr:aspartate aminotransferase family protein [Bacteriovoracaceae bacterium]